MTTPICNFSIIEPDHVSAFREACITDENVSCSWSILESWLNSLIVSDIWWLLTETERRSIAEMAIKNTFSKIFYKRTGKSNCEGGEGDWATANCVHNAIIRCLKFGTTHPGADNCYYIDTMRKGEFCFVPDTPYGLPCHYTSCIKIDASGNVIFAHALAAIQVVYAVDSIDNWIVFQYSDFDIKPGHRQMPHGSTVKIFKSYRYQCGVSYGTMLAEFSV